MSIPRGGLGRGLGALIPASAGPATLVLPRTEPVEDPPATVAGARFAELPLDALRPNPLQPRQHFEEQALAELVTSIREVGLLQPVVVRELARSAEGQARYELVMGERRWRAAREAGLSTVAAIIRDTADDAMLRDALLENLHRQELNPLEEAAAYQQLLAEFGTTHEELALRIGRSRPQITNTIRLLQLPAPVQRRVAAGVLSAGHARAILGLPDAASQEAMAARVVAEGMSVRAVEEAVALAQSATAEPTAAPRRGRRTPQPALLELADRLSDRFETRVKVDMGRAKGKVTIEFGSRDDLDRIVALLDAPEGATPVGGR
ncbi:MAG TPA: ParB/RepB/Spo0J family partition protein [Mycobacteriales bacterium]|nr:ParB/RepB/Spo0J family partition protein [Mycobacteriales bacterium]